MSRHVHQQRVAVGEQAKAVGYKERKRTDSLGHVESQCTHKSVVGRMDLPSEYSLSQLLEKDNILFQRCMVHCQDQGIWYGTGGSDPTAKDIVTAMVGNWSEVASKLKCSATALLEWRICCIQDFIICDSTLSPRLASWLTAHCRAVLLLITKQHGGMCLTLPPRVYPRIQLAVLPESTVFTKSTLADLDFRNSSQAVKLTKQSRLSHLLTKALPRRCQIRELQRFICDYCKVDLLVHDFMNRITLCSLLGLYDHCKHVSTFMPMFYTTVCLLYNKEQLPVHQSFSLFVMREYLVYKTRSIPALHACLCRHFNWITLENFTICTMNKIRLLWGQVQMPAFSSIGECWSPSTQQVAKTALLEFFTKATKITSTAVSQLNKMLTRLIHSHKPQSREWEDLLKMLSKVIDNEHDVSHTQSKETGSMERVYQTHLCTIDRRNEVARQTHPSGAACLKGVQNRLRNVGFKEESIGVFNVIMQLWHANEPVSKLQQYMCSICQRHKDLLVFIFHELYMVSMHFKAHIHELPLSVTMRQIVAADKAWKSMGGVQHSICSGVVLFCQSCGHIKTACIPGGTLHDKQTLVTGSFIKEQTVCPMKRMRFLKNNHGSNRVVVDDDEQRLYCEMGEYIEGQSVPLWQDGGQSTHQAVDGGAVQFNPKRQKSSNTRYATLSKLHCHRHTVHAINGMGTLIECKNALYMFCVECSRLMAFQEDVVCSFCNSIKRNKNLIFDCVCCGSECHIGAAKERQNDLAVAPLVRTTMHVDVWEASIVSTCKLCHRCSHTWSKHVHLYTQTTPLVNDFKTRVKDCILKKLIEKQRRMFKKR